MSYTKGKDKHTKKIVKDATEEGNESVKTLMTSLKLDNLEIRKELKDFNKAQSKRDKISMIVRLIIFSIMLWQFGFVQAALAGDLPENVWELTLKIIRVMFEMFV